MAKPTGIFLVDLSGLNLPPSDLDALNKEINAVVQRQLAKIDKTKGLNLASIGGPLGGGLQGYFPSREVLGKFGG